MRISTALSMMGLIVWLTPSSGGSDNTWPEFPLELDEGALREFMENQLPENLGDLLPEDWELFWIDVEQLLQAQSLEAMAEFQSTVRQMLDYLDAFPAAQPWTDWLRQRADYFDMAADIIRDVPARASLASASSAPWHMAAAQAAPASATIPKVAVKRRPPVIPPVVLTRRPVTAPIQQKRLAAIHQPAAWKTRLAGRPMPARAPALLAAVKTAFQREGMPAAWVWIAEVESSFNPRARSPTGALGLFQLMPATANRFGLRTGFADERQDPAKSATAAARYLKTLYRQMGSWPLALAAYNAGEGRVRRLLKEQKAHTFDAIADALPLETQMYVPKVLAIVALREGVEPTRLPAPVAELPDARPVTISIAGASPLDAEKPDPYLFAGFFPVLEYLSKEMDGVVRALIGAEQKTDARKGNRYAI